MFQHPELRNGDRMSREEFLHTWEQLPDVKHAELIRGVVYLERHVTVAHGAYRAAMCGWLGRYALASAHHIQYDVSVARRLNASTRPRDARAPVKGDGTPGGST